MTLLGCRMIVGWGRRIRRVVFWIEMSLDSFLFWKIFHSLMLFVGVLVLLLLFLGFLGMSAFLLIFVSFFWIYCLVCSRFIWNVNFHLFKLLVNLCPHTNLLDQLRFSFLRKLIFHTGKTILNLNLNLMDHPINSSSNRCELSIFMFYFFQAEVNLNFIYQLSLFQMKCPHFFYFFYYFSLVFIGILQFIYEYLDQPKLVKYKWKSQANRWNLHQIYLHSFFEYFRLKLYFGKDIEQNTKNIFQLHKKVQD